MKLTEEQYELIDAYLANDLSTTDRASLEADIAADEELRAEVDYQQTLRGSLRVIGIQRAVDRARDSYKARQTPATPAVRPLLQPTKNQSTDVYHRWKYWVAAASVLLVLGIGYVSYQQINRQSYTASLISEQTDDLVKEFPQGKLSTPVRAQLLTALDTYRKGKYDAVIDQLKTLPSTGDTQYFRAYFLGLSYVANQQPADAIPLLKRALAAPSPTLRQKAEWILALAYVKNSQSDEALPILTRISADDTSPFNDLAKQVLEKIQ